MVDGFREHAESAVLQLGYGGAAAGGGGSNGFIAADTNAAGVALAPTDEGQPGHPDIFAQHAMWNNTGGCQDCRDERRRQAARWYVVDGRQ